MDRPLTKEGAEKLVVDSRKPKYCNSELLIALHLRSFRSLFVKVSTTEAENKARDTLGPGVVVPDSEVDEHSHDFAAVAEDGEAAGAHELPA